MMTLRSHAERSLVDVFGHRIDLDRNDNFQTRQALGALVQLDGPECSHH